MNLSINFIKILIWKYFGFARPKNFVVEGKFIISYKTKVILKGNSVLKIKGNVDFSDSIIELVDSEFICESIICNHSKIYAKDSKIRLGKFANFKNSSLSLINSNIETADHFRIHHYDFILENSKITVENYLFFDGDIYQKINFKMINSSMITGSNVRIQASILINNAILKIGNNTFINKGSQINCQMNISIGNYVMVSYDCLVFDNNSHSINYLDRQSEIDAGFPNGTLINNTKQVQKESVIIEDDVWVGTRSMIFKGVTIGSKAIVAANTVVTKNVASSHLVYGNPNCYKLIE
jgi:acetyltransferase-like isoleucine patch superfamily enzyme